MKNERGSLLIAGLWAMSIFSVMSASLNFAASEQVMLLKRDLEDFRSRLDFISGLNQAGAKIQGDPYPHEDSPDDMWFGNGVEDEESKLNLNNAPEALIAAFFKVFEDRVVSLKGSRKDYVKGISKLRAIKKIQSLEELLLMEEFESEDLELLRPYVTVYPEFPFVNINTAKPFILEALLDFLSGDSGAKQIFLGRLEEAGRSFYFRSEDLKPEIFAEKLKLPKTPVMLALVQEFLSYVTTDSETFHISMKAVGERRANAIFRYRVGQTRPYVLWWHEE